MNKYCLCIYCKKPILRNDLGAITNKGLLHKKCCFKVIYCDKKDKIIGYELRIKEE